MSRLKNVLKQRKLQGVPWDELAKNLPVKGNALRTAFTRESVSDAYLEEIERILGITHNTQNPEAMSVDFTEMQVMYVPLVSKFAYAGYLGGYGDDEYIGDLPKIPFANGFRPKGKYRCFEVRGDSMTANSRDSIEEGDIILGREVKQEYWQSKLHINQWDFIIVHREDGILVKRIIDHDVEKGILRLHSLNEYYEDFEVHLKDVAQIFNIVEITKKPRR